MGRSKRRKKPGGDPRRRSAATGSPSASPNPPAQPSRDRQTPQTPPKSGSRFRSIVLLALCTGVVGGLWFAAGLIKPAASAAPINAHLQSEPGTSKFDLDVPNDSIPIVCGCMEPQPDAWVGLAIPARSFTLRDKSAQPGPWLLQVGGPDTGALGWRGAWMFPLNVEVRVARSEFARRSQVIFRSKVHTHGDRLFNQGVHQLSLITDGGVRVDAKKRIPLLGLTPADGATQVVQSEPGARSSEASTVSVESSTDAYDPATTDAEVRSFSPSIDVAAGGQLKFPVKSDTRLLVGSHRLALTTGDFVTVAVSSPSIGLRLLPVPTTASALDKLDESNDGADAWRRVIDVTGGALPAHVLHLGQVETPSEAEWASFVELVKKAANKDEYGMGGWPPITRSRMVTVFGAVPNLSSTSMTGTVASGPKRIEVARGEPISVQFTGGLAASGGPTLALSSGSEPVQDSFSGPAFVRVGGEPFSTSDSFGWLRPALGWLLIALLTLLLERIVETVVSRD